MLFILRPTSLLIAVLAISTLPASAEVITRFVTFDGPQQTADFEVTGDGSLFAAGSGVLGGPFVIMEIPAGSGGQTRTFGLNPDTVVGVSHPTSWPDPLAEGPEDPSAPSPPTRVDFDKSTSGPHKKVLHIGDLHLDLLTGGDKIPIAFDRVNIKLQKTAGGFGTLNADISIDIARVEFVQTGPAVLVDAQSGEFSVPGTVRSTLAGEIRMVNKAFHIANLDNEVIETEIDLPVFASVTDAGRNELGQAQRLVTLDAHGSIDLPIGFDLAIVQTEYQPFFSFTGTLSLLGNLMLDVSVHLEDTVVPEPSSFILLALGLAALVPLARSRFRRQ